MSKIGYDLQGYPLATKKVSTTNAVNTIVNLYMGSNSTLITETIGTSVRVPQAILITCESNDIRWTVGVAVPDNANNIGHLLAANDSMRLVGVDMVTTLKVVSKTNGSAAVLQVTPEYF